MSYSRGAFVRIACCCCGPEGRGPQDREVEASRDLTFSFIGNQDASVFFERLKGEPCLDFIFRLSTICRCNQALAAVQRALPARCGTGAILSCPGSSRDYAPPFSRLRSHWRHLGTGLRPGAEEEIVWLHTFRREGERIVDAIRHVASMYSAQRSFINVTATGSARLPRNRGRDSLYNRS